MDFDWLWDISFEGDEELLALARGPKNPRPTDTKAWAKSISNDWHEADQREYLARTTNTEASAK